MTPMQVPQNDGVQPATCGTRCLVHLRFNAQLAPLSRATKQITIVFVGVSDPVGSGYVASFARPGGNITGFTLYEPSMAGKWLGTLKLRQSAAPEVHETARAAGGGLNAVVLRNLHGRHRPKSS